MHHEDNDRAKARHRAIAAAHNSRASRREARALALARAAGLVMMAGLALGLLAPERVGATSAVEFLQQEQRRQAASGDAQPQGGLLGRLFAPRPSQQPVQPAVPQPPPQAQPRERTTQAALGKRTICVRLCDGYAFPLGELERTRDLALHDLACNAGCPGAPTKVFTLDAGAETFDDARAEDGTRYADLPVAYAYRNAIDGTCSCQGPNRRVADRLDIRHDMTLRRGDIVVTKEGPIVYQGRDGDPGDLSDFAAFDEARMPEALRAKADALLGISHDRALAREHARMRTTTTASAAREPGVAVP